MKRARAAAAIALALLASACGGPSRSMEVGVREIDTDVLIGPRPAQPSPSAPPFAGPPPGFPGFVQPPTGFPEEPAPRPTPTVVACPSADPLSAVRTPVTSSVERPPVAAGYRYRNEGSYSYGDRSGRFPPNATRIVSNVEPDAEGGGFRFDLTARGIDGVPTTTTYRVVPDGISPPAIEPGIYIERIVTTPRDGEPYHFAPTPSLMLMRLPAAIGQTWSARGVDPLAQIVMQFSGKIASRTVVDACGVRLEAWLVEITEGVIRGPSTDLTFGARVGIATQYGGISILDSFAQQGTENGTRLSSENTARISEEPARPR